MTENNNNSNNLPTIFNYGTSKVRTIVDEKGEPWFVAKDVCDVLGYTHGNQGASQAVRIHCREAGVMKNITPTSGGNQMITYVNERNLYRLIMRSKLPAAERFQDWVEDVVLPTIRKKGSYNHQEDFLNNPEALRKVLLQATEKVIEQKKQIEMMEPKAEAFDTFIDSEGTFTIKKVADMLGIGEKTLFAKLRKYGYLCDSKGYWNCPKKRSLDEGLFKCNITNYTIPGRTPYVWYQPIVTAKGLEHIRKNVVADFHACKA